MALCETLFIRHVRCGPAAADFFFPTFFRCKGEGIHVPAKRSTVLPEEKDLLVVPGLYIVCHFLL